MIPQEEKDKAVMEKRKHVRITSFCNNNCLFCLAGDKRKNEFKLGVCDLKQELLGGLQQGYTRLILSGGEPTINEEIFGIAKYSKKLGYNKIQVISNGRMLAYPKFAKELADSGVNEVTFSIHSHKEEVHDYLTGVEGSFNQAMRGLNNVLQLNLIVSVDIVLSALNIQDIKNTVKFFHEKGITEFDLLMVTPFGYAWDNQEELFFDVEQAMPFLKEAFDYAKKNDVVLWTNRLPAKYLEGYEDLIQDSNKIKDEVEGRKEGFDRWVKRGAPIACRDERCVLCYIKPYCDKLDETRKMKCFVQLPKKSEKLIALEAPEGSVSSYKKNVLSPHEILDLTTKAADKNEDANTLNIPRCMADPRCTPIKNKWNQNQELFYSDGKLDLDKFTREFVKNYKVKALRCRECVYDKDCEGIFQHYIKIFGFSVLTPFKNEN